MWRVWHGREFSDPCCFLSFKSCTEYQVRAPNNAVICSVEVHSGYHCMSLADRQIIESDESVRTEEQKKREENRWLNAWGLKTAHGHKGTN